MLPDIPKFVMFCWTALQASEQYAALLESSQVGTRPFDFDLNELEEELRYDFCRVRRLQRKWLIKR